MGLSQAQLQMIMDDPELAGNIQAQQNVINQLNASINGRQLSSTVNPFNAQALPTSTAGLNTPAAPATSTTPGVMPNNIPPPIPYGTLPGTLPPVGTPAVTDLTGTPTAHSNAIIGNTFSNTGNRGNSNPFSNTIGIGGGTLSGGGTTSPIGGGIGTGGLPGTGGNTSNSTHSTTVIPGSNNNSNPLNLLTSNPAFQNAIIAALTAISGGLSNRPTVETTQYGSSTTPNINPTAQNVINQSGDIFSKLAQDPDLSGYLANQTEDILHTSNQQETALESQLATHGITQGPASIAPLLNQENSKFAQIVGLRNQVPLLAKQIEQQTLQSGAGLINAIPAGISHSGTDTKTTSGNELGGALSGLTGILALMAGLNANGGGGNNTNPLTVNNYTNSSSGSSATGGQGGSGGSGGSGGGGSNGSGHPVTINLPGLPPITINVPTISSGPGVSGPGGPSGDPVFCLNYGMDEFGNISCIH